LNFKISNLVINFLWDNGIKLIAGNWICNDLETLNLVATLFSQKGVRYFGRNTKWKILSNLNLADNQTGDQGVRSVLETFWLDWNQSFNLKHLSFTSNEVKFLSNHEIGLIWKNLKELNLEENDTNNYSVVTLSHNRNWRSFVNTLYKILIGSSLFWSICSKESFGKELKLFRKIAGEQPKIDYNTETHAIQIYL
jgi:hypothetical protein